MNYQTKTKQELIAEIYALRCQLNTQECSMPADIINKSHMLINQRQNFIDNLPDIIERINKQQQQYKNLAENAPLIIARVDNNFRFIYLNPAFTTYTGLPYQDCIGKLTSEIGLSDYISDLWKNKLQELFKTGKEFLIEYESYTFNNDTKYFYQGQGVPEFDETGSIKSALCLILDNTKQKSLELKLRMKQQEFEALVTNAPDIITRIDKNFRHVYINPAVEKLSKIPTKSYINKTFQEIYTKKPVFIELWHKHLTKVFNNKKHTVFEFEYETENEDTGINGKHYYHTRMVPELAVDGSVEYALCICHDITSHKQMSYEMARLDRLNMVGEMAAGIGHEVRNPMTTVRGFLQMMLRKNEHEDQSKFFNIMIEELDRANSIITEFLSLAKNKPVDLKQQNINNIITSLLPLMQANGLVNNKYIHTELNEIPTLPLNEKEIRQLILNLVHNGIEAMSSGGNLYLKTYKDNNTIVLAVKDEGAGIPPEVLKKIGTPFFTTKEQGTGLGLAVCYSIARRHNASIHPKTGSKGTTFYVRFKEKPIT